MTTYIPTVGLEIHAELKTATKMFCNSVNDPDETRPNVNVCPVCMAHPGTLPTINRQAVEHVLRVGAAVGGTLADYTEFDRKNYFYPDIPKGYQISQYAFPLVAGGDLLGVALTRIHLEEDTARSQHEGNHSLVDYNRAGIPLMELVTEPVITSAEQAMDFAKELQLLLRTLGVADADMEKGQMRVEANISIRPEGTDELGNKVEIKNLNSFRVVGKAIAHELERQEKVLEGGGSVVQETRGWDEAQGITFSQRKKESSHDYRYFPEPDLPKLTISEVPEFAKKRLMNSLPELPWIRRERYRALGLKEEDARMFTTEKLFGDFFDEIIGAGGEHKVLLRAANYLASDIAGLVKEAGGTMPFLSDPNAAISFIELMRMAEEGKLSSRGVKEVIAVFFEEGGDPENIAEEHGLLQQSDKGALEEIVEKVMNEHPNVVTEYRSGKTTAVQYLVGQAMKATRGAGNPQVLKTLFEKKLT